MRAALLACVAALAFAQGAAAATVTLEYEPPLPGVDPDAAYSLSVVDRNGESNDLHVSGDGSAYFVRDSLAPLTPGEGCAPVTANEVRCPTTETATDRSVYADGGGAADLVAIGPLAPAADAEVRGGAGPDMLIGHAGQDALRGETGDDSIAGGAGDDRLDGGRGNDRLFGGDGRDAISYQSRTTPVTVDLAAGTGGEAGERDELAAVEEVVGGRAADHLAGDGGWNTLLGGEGDARDTLVGRAGNDVLVGYRATGGTGDDNLDARKYSCGSGDDFLSRSLYRTRGPYPLACETILAVFVVMRPRPVTQSRRRLGFDVKCRYDPRSCSGTLELRDRDGRLGRTRYTLRRGEAERFARVAVRLDRRPAGRVITVRLQGRSAFDRDRFRFRLP